MKIGILTFWWSEDNYGQLLQAFALQKYLNNLGHDAFLIRYIDNEKTPFSLRLRKVLNLKKLIKYLTYRINRLKATRENSLHDRKFNDFRRDYIKYTEKIYYSYKELQQNPPPADIYIVGSDQVWNPNYYSKQALNAYFLNFGDMNTRRMSYSASWGVEFLENEVVKLICPMIKKFDYISVREKKGVDICNQYFNLSAEWVPDPTLLLSAVDYRELYRNCDIQENNRKYVLLYLLNNTCEFYVENVYEFSKTRNLDVIYVTGNGRIDSFEKKYPTVQEWLSLIDNAEYVITNSFHCSVFSILFNKKFGVVKLSGMYSGMNERLYSLFELVGITERFIQNNDFSILDVEYLSNEIENKNSFVNKLV